MSETHLDPPESAAPESAAPGNDPDEEPLATGTVPKESAGGRRPGRAGLVLAWTAVALLGVLALVLGVLLVNAEGSDDAEADLRRTAGQFGEALVTYDHRDPDAHRDTVLGYATGSFREEYEDAFDQGLSQIITEVEAVSSGFVKDVYLTEVDRGQASAVVVVDIEHDGTAGPRTIYDIYFRLTMVLVEDEWKVDQVTDLSFGSGPAAGPDAAPDVTTDTTGSTTTSVP